MKKVIINSMYLKIITRVIVGFIFVSFYSCGPNVKEIEKREEQRLKDSIYTHDSLNKAIENKRMVDSILVAGIPENHHQNIPSTGDHINHNYRGQGENSMQQNVSSAEADEFMKSRLEQSGQFIVSKMVYNFNGTLMYCYLSTGPGNLFCISSITEHKLEVLATDCGSETVKVKDWEELMQRNHAN